MHEPNLKTISNGHPDNPDIAPREGGHVPVMFSKGTGRHLLVAICSVAIVLGIAFFLVRHSKANAAARLDETLKDSAEHPTSVDVLRVEYAAPVHLLTLPADLGAYYQTTIYARTSGYLKKWYVDIGDKVKAGQLLATIEAPDVDDQLTAAQAKLASSTAEVRVAQAAADFAKVSAGRYSGAEDGVVSMQERDEKKSGLEGAEAKLVYAQSQVKLDQAEVQRLTTMTNFQKVLAPFDGVITQRRVDIGDLVTAGSTTNTTSLFTLVQAEQIRAFVDVPQAATSEIHTGMTAKISAQQYPGRTFTGSVDRTAGALNPTSKTLRVEVLVPNPDLALMPGMYVQVSFETTRLKPPLRVPAAAMSFRSGGAQVAIVNADGSVHFQKVQIARDLGDFVEVQSGLSPDDRVVLNIGSDVVDGDKVTPIERAATAAKTTSTASADAPASSEPVRSTDPVGDNRK